MPDDARPAIQLEDSAGWVRSQFCSANDCLELAPAPGGGVAIRNSTAPTANPVVADRAEFAAFVEGVKAGDFDHLLG